MQAWLIAVIVIAALVVVSLASLAGATGVRHRRQIPLEPPAPRRPPFQPGGKSPAGRGEDRTEGGRGTAVRPPEPGAAERPEVVPPPPRPGEVEEAERTAVEVAPRPGFRDRLGKARGLFSGYVSSVLSRSGIDAETWDEIEEALIRSDVGVTTTTTLLEGLRSLVDAGQVRDPGALVVALRGALSETLAGGDRSLQVGPDGPTVWMFVGVNGVGKTTTIGKLAARQRASGWSVLLAAGDTFRAAAAEQLELWSRRAEVEVVRGAEGGDPASVVFDAVQRAASRGVDLVLADTAGRLHTKVNLMEELKKVRRVAERPPGQVREVLLVIDATTGQNGLAQARQFTEAVGVTGVVLTKLDGTAKGGIVVAIQAELGVPVKLVGLGESLEDLVDFDPDAFVDALVG